MIFQSIVTHDYAKPLKERAKARKSCGPYTWAPRDPRQSDGFNFYCKSGSGLAMDRAGSICDLRLEWARDLLPSSRSYRLPLAYWADEFGDCTMTPIVARLPHGKGFLAGWTMGAGMCASLSTTIWTDEQEAARAAFDEAESAAERERDYQESETARLNEEEED
jgi:hypothetical protein